MRVLLSTIGTRGEVQPLVALASLEPDVAARARSLGPMVRTDGALAAARRLTGERP